MAVAKTKARTMKKTAKARAGTKSNKAKSQKGKSTKRTTKKRLTAVERRAQIVETASTLFSKKGFKGTTTREIAKAASVSEATIYKHFSTKESLYRAIIDRCSDDEEGCALFMKAMEGKEGRDLFVGFATYMINRYKEDPSFGRLLLFGALEERRFSDIFMKSKGMETYQFIVEHLKKLSKRGAVRKVDPELAARAFMGMVIHYAMAQEIYGFKRFFNRPTEEVASVFVDIYMNGISKKRSK